MARLTDQPQVPPPVSAGGPRRRPLPPASPALYQRSWAALTLAALSLLALVLTSGGPNVRRSVVVVVVALAIAGLGLSLGISAASAARRAGTARPRGSVAAIVLAAAGLAFSAFTLAAFAMFWPQLTTLSSCMSGAGTVSAQDACQQQFDNSVSARITILGGR